MNLRADSRQANRDATPSNSTRKFASSPRNALGHPRPARGNTQNSGKNPALFCRHWRARRNRLETQRILRVPAAKAQAHPRSSRAERRKSGKNPDVPIRPQSRAQVGIGGLIAAQGRLPDSYRWWQRIGNGERDLVPTLTAGWRLV
jgi:hypothetical protein